MRKLRKLVLTLVFVCALFMGSVPMQAKAETTPPTVDDAYVLSRLSQLAGLLGINEGNLNPGDGMYFTVNQQKCGTGLSSHGCDNCKNSNIANATWFKNLFGTVYVGGFPKQYDNKGIAGGHIGKSCWGFANFAMWYATSTQNTDNVIGTLVTTSTFTKENILSIMKPGYIIRCNGHSMVFISADENKMKVMDCNYRPNYDVTNCRVRIREFTYDSDAFNYFKGKSMGITRAGNYDPNKSEKTPPIMSNFLVVDKDNTGYTICVDVTDNLGVAKVCFPTWTEANGQDDLDVNWQNTLVAFEPVIGNTYAYRINTSDHNEEGGVYITDVYAFDASGNHLMTRVTVNVDKTKPTINGSYVKDVDATGYTVVCKATDNDQMGGIKFSTWTSANEQDDLKVTDVTGIGAEGVYNIRINVTDHGSASGEYKTEVYAYDISGNATKVTLPAQIPAPAMTEQEKQIRAFVERMYTVALGRTAEADGLDFYTEKLLAGDSNGACLAESFLCSPEFLNKGHSDAEYVKVLYRTFFDREPAAEEVNYWVEKLASGQTRAFVLSGFVNSVEFDNLCASYGISRGFMREDGKPLNPGIGRFAERLYTVVLERAGEKDGIEYWSLNMANGTCTPKDAAKSFFLSQEYINKNTSDAQYITTLYRTFMDREPEAGGVEYWQNVLNNGATREQILEGFADSAEFKGIMASFGL